MILILKLLINQSKFMVAEAVAGTYLGLREEDARLPLAFVQQQSALTTELVRGGDEGA